MQKWIFGLGVILVSLYIILGFTAILNWTIVGVLSTATIGIVGWTLNYLLKSKERAIHPAGDQKLESTQSKQPRLILKETCRLDKKEYVARDLDLDAAEIVKGEITSNEPVNIYFLTEYSFRRYEDDEDFTYQYSAESILEKKIQFQPTKTATWYLVVENEGKETAVVNIKLFV